VCQVRWEGCSKCQSRMEAAGLSSEAELQSWFVTRISNYLASRNRRLIGEGGGGGGGGRGGCLCAGVIHRGGRGREVGVWVWESDTHSMCEGLIYNMWQS